MIVAEDRNLSVDEAAKRLGVHPNTVRNAIEQGRMRATKVLGRWRIRESEVERVLHGGHDDSKSEQDN